ncbi:MAG: hypothetical protein OXF02_05470 [Simkaniaceae bacterium]|nr:hypothetical protein [Simkaniaceae bacterium]
MLSKPPWFESLGFRSASPVAPFFRIATGPLCIALCALLSMSVSHVSIPVWIALVGLFPVRRWRLRGLIAVVSMTVLAFCCSRIFAGGGSFLWHAGLLSSLILAPVIFLLSIEEAEADYAGMLDAHKKAMAEKDVALSEMRALHEEEIGRSSFLLKGKERTLQEALGDVAASLTLVEAVRLEKEELLRRGEMLLQESAESHRLIEIERLRVKRLEECLKEVEKEKEGWRKIGKGRLAELNAIRVEHKQGQLLLEEARSALNAVLSSGSSEKGGVDPIAQLEREKTGAKRDYELRKKEYDGLLLQLKKIGVAEGEEVLFLKKRSAHAKSELALSKSRLTDVERELFILKKENRGGSYVGVSPERTRASERETPSANVR